MSGTQTMTRPRFHLAFPVDNLTEARAFFTGVLGCSEGRSAPRWIDFDFFGHQISAHLCNQPETSPADNEVDGDRVPIRHFGLILDWEDWTRLRDRLVQHKAHFIIDPKIRFRGGPGEQATMFLSDPSGNYLEFKSFASDADIFATC